MEKIQKTIINYVDTELDKYHVKYNNIIESKMNQYYEKEFNNILTDIDNNNNILKDCLNKQNEINQNYNDIKNLLIF